MFFYDKVIQERERRKRAPKRDRRLVMETRSSNRRISWKKNTLKKQQQNQTYNWLNSRFKLRKTSTNRKNKQAITQPNLLSVEF